MKLYGREGGGGDEEEVQGRGGRKIVREKREENSEREEGGRGQGHHCTVGDLSLGLVLVSWWLCVCERERECVCV